MKRNIKEFFTINSLKHLLLIPKIIAKIKNWPSFLSNYIGLSSTKDDVIFRDGTLITISDSHDIATIAVVYLKEDYGKVNSGDIVIDIGANIGTFSIMAAKQGATVYAYEPMPETYTRLANNIFINNLNSIRFINFGVADKACIRKLYVTEGSVFNNMYGKGNHVNINCISLDDVFVWNHISHCDVLKIDIEGAEYETFYNASSLTLSKVKEIRMEYHTVQNNNIDDLIAFLESNEFKLTKKRIDNGVSGIVWLKKNL